MDDRDPADKIASPLWHGLVEGEERNVVSGLYAIATALDRMASALELVGDAASGPWPSALAEALAKERVL